MNTGQSSKRKIIGFTALASAALTTLVTVSIEAAWKPAANYFVDDLATRWFGEQWVGIYNEPTVPATGSRPKGQADVSKLPHQRTKDVWKITPSSDGFARATFNEEQAHSFEAVGLFKNEALVLALRGTLKGRGVIHLEKTQLEYYKGYATLCDCTAPTQAAVMICPYILYKPTDTAAAELAKSDPFLSQKCVSKLADGNGA